MKKLLWAIAFLISVLGARADTLDVTSGSIQIYGPGGDIASFSGDGFTATGEINFTGACPEAVLDGQPIVGCAGFDYVSGSLTLTMNGVNQPVNFGNDFGTTITQAPMFLSGATQATLSEPAAIGALIGCASGMCSAPPPGQGPNTVLSFAGDDISTSISLTQNPLIGGYDITSEVYTISDSPTTSTPEPGTFGLMLVGIGFLFVMGRRKAPGLRQAT